jgi:hypothetical protein
MCVAPPSYGVPGLIIVLNICFLRFNALLQSLRRCVNGTSFFQVTFWGNWNFLNFAVRFGFET